MASALVSGWVSASKGVGLLLGHLEQDCGGHGIEIDDVDVRLFADVFGSSHIRLQVLHEDTIYEGVMEDSSG